MICFINKVMRSFMTQIKHKSREPPPYSNQSQPESGEVSRTSIPEANPDLLF